MKKIISLTLIFVLCLCLTGCSTEPGTLMEGPYDGEGFSFSVPEGWYLNDDQAALSFLPAGFPDEAYSYISLTTSSENQISVIDIYMSSIISDMKTQFETSLGENAIYTIGEFVKGELGGNECYSIVCYFVKDGTAFKQEQYTFDTSSGSVTISYVLADGEDYAAAYEESKASIVIE